MNKSEVGIPTPEIQTHRETPIPGAICQLSEVAISIGLTTDPLELQSKIYNPHYIPFESLRRGPRQPFFVPKLATGFEGYWIGSTEDPKEVMSDLLDIGKAALDESAKYGTNMYFRMLHALKGYVMDPEAMHFAEELFLAIRDSALELTQDTEVAREDFRKTTHQSIDPQIHTIRYIKKASSGSPSQMEPYSQEIQLPDIKSPAKLEKLTRPMCLDAHGKPVPLDTHEHVVLDFIQTIGVIGHPLVRRSIESNLYDDLAIVKFTRTDKPEFHHGKYLHLFSE